MIIHEKLVQGTEAWFALRRGRPTASNFSKILTAKTEQPSSSADGYIRELIAECFCPDVQAFTGNKWTDRGNDLESEAREAFEKHTGLDVEEVGFCTRDDGVVGCSPDGLIRGSDGEWVAGLEVKCPGPKEHVDCVLNGGLPDKHKQQVHGGMAVTGLDQWHFWSYLPGMKPLHVVVERDGYTEKLSAWLDTFLITYGREREKAIPKLQLEEVA